MSENRQSRLLAQWLSEPRGIPPSELDAEVEEAVLALRPDLAPPPRVDIDEILAMVQAGPLAADPAAEQREVQALLTWLEAHPGSEPPVEGDPTTLEAVYALRPDLAPPPRLALDDIFRAVSEGPFARPTLRLVASPPAQPVQGPPTVTRLPEQRQRRVPWWALPGAGVAALAATVLVFAIPASMMVMDAPTPFDQAEPAAVATPSSAPGIIPEVDAAPGKATSVDAGEGQGEAGDLRQGLAGEDLSGTGGVSTEPAPSPDAAALDPVPAAHAELERLGYLEGGRGGSGPSREAAPPADKQDVGAGLAEARPTTTASQTARPAPVASPTVPPASLASRDEDRRAAEPTEKAEAAGGRASARTSASADRKNAEEEEELKAVESKERQRASRSGGSRAKTPKVLGAKKAAPADGHEEARADWGDDAVTQNLIPEVVDAPVVAGSTSTLERSQSAPAGAGWNTGALDNTGADGNTAGYGNTGAYGNTGGLFDGEEADQEAAPDDDVSLADETLAEGRNTGREWSKVSAGDSRRGLDDLRSDATSIYRSRNPIQNHPDAAIVWARAEAARQAGDWITFYDEARPLLQHQDGEVAAHVAWEMARRQLQQANTAEALRTIDLGLSRGSSDLSRARLLALRGEVLERRGDTEGAIDAYRDSLEMR